MPRLSAALWARSADSYSEVLREAALNGSGIALLPSWLVLPGIQSGQLTKLFEDDEVNPNDAQSLVAALYLPNHRGSKHVNAFIDLLLKTALPQP
ncbi:LysR substrate-binding domain-containing protein [Caballeronia sp. SEWSISQ10-4 2]|uniref:LysR substrate-binding domain-containing protein n=1 Tax=Caballeronia sp. SEWSISQ10-4 2 TaxID=2937438 RepID=UPI00265267FC|nr:LysR substrate-binding domain-containing protein [Caballeronia sp. SEWSISQ10-4 2]MDN7179577.1 LysR substrate-binding domain-containing protein [Caballeronia sp. SEWSISQ10-4 2]